MHHILIAFLLQCESHPAVLWLTQCLRNCVCSYLLLVQYAFYRVAILACMYANSGALLLVNVHGKFVPAKLHALLLQHNEQICICYFCQHQRARAPLRRLQNRRRFFVAASLYSKLQVRHTCEYCRNNPAGHKAYTS